MKLSIVVGTRPELIKASPLIRYCEKKNIDYFIIHSGQHYSYNMNKLFFEELRLPEPKYNLDIKSSAPYLQAEHTGRMMIELEKILLKELPNIVLVIGDTNTVLAASLTTKKLTTTRDYTGIDIKLGHIEAGLRSYNQLMPEETNRIIADHLSDYLFVPSERARSNLLDEKIRNTKIYLTGNTIVDATLQNLELSNKNILDSLNLEDYFLVTAHRQENVDVKNKLKDIIDGLKLVHDYFKIPIIYPLHPRTKLKLKNFNINVPTEITLIEPCGYLEFLQLEKNAKLILTDSGGLQEESCILKVPCVTLREDTERPETIDIGANILAGTNPNRMLEAVQKMIDIKREWPNPYGNGDSSEKIINLILSFLTKT